MWVRQKEVEKGEASEKWEEVEKKMRWRKEKDATGKRGKEVG